MKKIGKILGMLAAATMLLAGCTFEGGHVLSKISVKDAPVQVLDKAFNPAGLVLTGTYSNGDSDIKYDDKIAYRFSFSEYKPAAVGAYKMSVTYTEGGIETKADFSVNVKKVTEKKDKDGKVIETTEEIITKDETIETKDKKKVSDVEKVVTISDKDGPTSITVTRTFTKDSKKDKEIVLVIDKDGAKKNDVVTNPDFIKIKTKPTKLEYVIDETLDPEGIVVLATWKDEYDGEEIKTVVDVAPFLSAQNYEADTTEEDNKAPVYVNYLTRFAKFDISVSAEVPPTFWETNPGELSVCYNTPALAKFIEDENGSKVLKLLAGNWANWTYTLKEPIDVKGKKVVVVAKCGEDETLGSNSYSYAPKTEDWGGFKLGLGSDKTHQSEMTDSGEGNAGFLDNLTDKYVSYTAKSRWVMYEIAAEADETKINTIYLMPQTVSGPIYIKDIRFID